MFVEAVRLLVTLVTTAIGFGIGRAWVGWFPAANLDPDVAAITGALLGAGIGYVIGGVFGRFVHRGLDSAPRALDRASGAELFAGTFGLIAGLVLGVVAGVPAIVLLPANVGWPIFALIVLVAATFGYRLFSARADDLLSVAGLKRVEAFAPAPESEVPVGECYLIDSAAAIDGRVLELARSGLLHGPVWVPRFVVDELQAIADASDAGRRRRGRRGLEVLDAMRDQGGDDFELLDDQVPEHADVDAKLLALAERHSAMLVTTDHNLARNAGLRGLRVLNPHELGESLRIAHASGDRMTVTIEKAGSEPGQGVAYLDDGTMVVVSHGEALIGQAVDVEVSNVLRTAVGRLVFARLAAQTRAVG